MVEERKGNEPVVRDNRNRPVSYDVLHSSQVRGDKGNCIRPNCFMSTRPERAGTMTSISQIPAATHILPQFSKGRKKRTHNAYSPVRPFSCRARTLIAASFPNAFGIGPASTTNTCCKNEVDDRTTGHRVRSASPPRCVRHDVYGSKLASETSIVT